MAMASWSSILCNCKHWLSACFSTLARAASAFSPPVCLRQFGVEVLYSLFSHRKHFDSSYAQSLLVFPLFVGIIYPLFNDICCLDHLYKKIFFFFKNVKVNPLRAKTACTRSKDKGLKNLPWPNLFSKLETPRVSLVSSSWPCLEARVGAAPMHRPHSPPFPFGSL